LLQDREQGTQVPGGSWRAACSGPNRPGLALSGGPPLRWQATTFSDHFKCRRARRTALATKRGRKAGSRASSAVAACCRAAARCSSLPPRVAPGGAVQTSALCTAYDEPPFYVRFQGQHIATIICKILPQHYG